MSGAEWECIASDAVNIPDDSITTATSVFQQLIDTWTSSYQVVNKRLAGVERIEIGSSEAGEAIARVQLHLDVPSPYRVVKLAPKYSQNSRQCYDIVIYDEGGLETKIYPINLSTDAGHPHIDHPYALRLHCHSDERGPLLRLLVPNNCTEVAWLREMAFVKMLKWVRRIVEKDTDLSACNSLLDASSYHARYAHIKETWGRELVEKWTERTDPTKFVFEDVGIATYLLEYWRKHCNRPPTLVADLGCGNGLLAYFLQQEGVKTVGIDVRRRRIWTQLGGVADLREMPIDPSSSSYSTAAMGLPEGVTFLVGNHSDELTPWIPVMAARLGIGFFLLPCCPFDFLGKFSKNCGISTGLSEQYYAYVHSLIQRLGFDCHVDKLKIPSHKRKCFIGVVPPGGLPSNVDSIIEEMLTRQRALAARAKREQQFVPRPTQIEQRNCTAIPLELRQALVRKIFNYLLYLSEESIGGWRCGGSAPMLTLSEQLSPEDKAVLRSQHGGLQTLLKNHNQIFLVQGGRVEIRKWPLLYAAVKAKMRSPYKQQCWFLHNHPDGCGVKEEGECPYLHS